MRGRGQERKAEERTRKLMAEIAGLYRDEKLGEGKPMICS